MKKWFLFVPVLALAMPLAVSVVKADSQPSLWIDNDTSYSLPYKTWSDQYAIGTVSYNAFTLNTGLEGPNDFHGDSESAQASPTVPGGVPLDYHWDLPTGTNTVKQYGYYIYLYNNSYDNPQTLYWMDKSYSNQSSFYVNQATAVVGWHNYATVSTYGTAHMEVRDLCSDGQVTSVTFTGADGVGLQ